MYKYIGQKTNIGMVKRPLSIKKSVGDTSRRNGQGGCFNIEVASNKAMRVGEIYGWKNY